MFLKSAVKYVFTGAFLSLSYATVVVAESPYQTEVQGDKAGLHNLARELNDGAIRLASPLRAKESSVLRLSMNAAGLGHMKILLNKVQYKSWDSYLVNSSGNTVRDPKDVILVSGHAIKRNGRKVPVGGSIYHEGNKPLLHLIINGSRAGNRSYSVKAPLNSKLNQVTAKVSSVPSSARGALGCGVNEEHDHSAHAASGLVRAAGTTSGAAVIATDADEQYTALYGASTNAHIATIVNAASAIYQNQMGISLVLGTQHAFTGTSPYPSSDANALLTSFLTYTASNGHLGVADAYHLFSGKDFVGSTIGLAYVGVVCLYPDYAFGTTQRYHDAADASIFAHELGHNFGAGHDATDPNSLMAPYVSVPGSTYFSTASVGAIRGHLASSPTCLDATGGGGGSGGGGGVAPTPTPDPEDPTAPPVTLSASISAKTRTLKFRVDVSAINGCPIVLTASEKKNGAGTEFYSFIPTAASTTFSVTKLVDPKTVKSYLYLSAEMRCTGISAYTDPKKVSLDGLRDKTKKKMKDIIKALVKAFSGSSSSRNKRIK